MDKDVFVKCRKSSGSRRCVSGHRTHSYFCFICPIDFDRVLNLPNPVRLYDLWLWPEFRLALDLWSTSCLSVCLFMSHRSQFNSSLHQTVHTGRHRSGKNVLGFQGHRVEGPGHTATAMQISAILRSLFDLVLISCDIFRTLMMGVFRCCLSAANELNLSLSTASSEDIWKLILCRQ